MQPDFLGVPHYPTAFDAQLRARLASEPGSLESIRTAVESSPILSYRPLPQAVRFHASRARNRFALGGNRSSKSHALVHEVAFMLLGAHPFPPVPYGAKGWYATQTYSMIGETLWPKLEEILKGFDYDVAWISQRENIPRFVRIPLPGNVVSKLTYKAYEQGRKTFQAADLDFVAFDEQFPQDIYVETMSRIGAGKRLRFMAAMTPIEPQPWLEERLTSSNLDPTQTEVFEFPLDDNRVSAGGFIDDELIDAVIAEWPEEVVETRRKGKWGSYIGAIFQTFKRETHVVRDEDEHKFLLAGYTPTNRHIPPQLRAVGSIDWGGANPFVFLWGIRLPHLDNAWYVFDEYYWASRSKGQRRIEEHAAEIKDRTTNRWQTVLERTWSDHDPTDVYEMMSYGVESMPADKSVLPSIEYIRTLLKVREDTGRPRLYIAERCKNLVREVATYKWAKGTEQKDGKDEPAKKDDHSVDALRYLLYSERNYDSTPVLIDLGTLNRRVF